MYHSRVMMGLRMTIEDTGPCAACMWGARAPRPAGWGWLYHRGRYFWGFRWACLAPLVAVLGVYIWDAGTFLGSTGMGDRGNYRGKLSECSCILVCIVWESDQGTLCTGLLRAGIGEAARCSCALGYTVLDLGKLDGKLLGCSIALGYRTGSGEASWEAGTGSTVGCYSRVVLYTIGLGDGCLWVSLSGSSLVVSHCTLPPLRV